MRKTYFIFSLGILLCPFHNQISFSFDQFISEEINQKEMIGSDGTTISGVQSWLAWLIMCTSSQISTDDLTLVAWSQPWWEDLHHGNWQTLPHST